jgi:flagellar motor switch protein FliM
MRKLRAHETRFVNATAARAELFLRSEFSLALGAIQIETRQKLIEQWTAPTHLILFKTEPLRGVSVLEIPLRLGLTMADHLLGGPGRIEQTTREMSQIEKALLDQFAQIILEEWCNNWTVVKPLKPSLLGCESNGRFLQADPPPAHMLTLALDASLGDCSGQFKLAFPCASLEPCLRQLCLDCEPPAETPAPAAPVKWNHSLDDVALPVTAEWLGLELSARDVLRLKVGDILQVNPQLARQVCLRLDGQPKFNGRPGMVSGHWAVQLTQAVKL